MGSSLGISHCSDNKNYFSYTLPDFVYNDYRVCIGIVVRNAICVRPTYRQKTWRTYKCHTKSRAEKHRVCDLGRFYIHDTDHIACRRLLFYLAQRLQQLATLQTAQRRSAPPHPSKKRRIVFVLVSFCSQGQAPPLLYVVLTGLLCVVVV